MLNNKSVFFLEKKAVFLINFILVVLVILSFLFNINLKYFFYFNITITFFLSYFFFKHSRKLAKMLIVTNIFIFFYFLYPNVSSYFSELFGAESYIFIIFPYQNPLFWNRNAQKLVSFAILAFASFKKIRIISFNFIIFPL